MTATAEGGGVLRQYLQGVGEQGQAKALAFPLQLPDREGGNRVLSLDLEAVSCQLPTLPIVYIPPHLMPLPARELLCSQGHLPLALRGTH